MGIYQIKPNLKYYMDDRVAKRLNQRRKLVLKKNSDFCFVVDGEEGSGKSYLGLNLAKFLDPSFNLSRIAFTGHQFLKCVQTAKPGQSIVFDEAFTGLSSRASMSSINKLLVETLMEIRQKQLILVIILPSVYYLDRYLLLHRSQCLFHTYMKSDRRGQYCIYNKKQLKQLALKGKKEMIYNVVKPAIRARFTKYFALDKEGEHIQEKRYIELKRKALHNKGKNRAKESHVFQRKLVPLKAY